MGIQEINKEMLLLTPREWERLVAGQDVAPAGDFWSRLEAEVGQYSAGLREAVEAFLRCCEHGEWLRCEPCTAALLQGVLGCKEDELLKLPREIWFAGMGMNLLTLKGYADYAADYIQGWVDMFLPQKQAA